MASNRPPAKAPAAADRGPRNGLAPRAAGSDDRLAIGETQNGAQENSGFDPYNSSGSFDRRKNWERVRKR